MKIINFLKIVKDIFLVDIGWKFLLAFIFLAYVSLQLKLNVTPVYQNGHLDNMHQLLISFNYTNNEQSRLFQFYIPELFTKVGFTIVNAYKFQRFLFTFLTFCCFYLYSRKWFDEKISFASVLLLNFITAFSFMSDLQESAPLMSLTFLLALWAIRERNTVGYIFILWLGSVNNETMLFVPAVYFLVNFESFNLKKLFNLMVMTIVYALPALLTVLLIRYINIDRPHLGGAFHWHENINNLSPVFMIFGVFWIYACLKFTSKPLFLKRSLISIPLFILPHLITGIINETRQMIPLSFIIIPSAFYFIFLDQKGINEN